MKPSLSTEAVGRNSCKRKRLGARCPHSYSLYSWCLCWQLLSFPKLLPSMALATTEPTPGKTMEEPSSTGVQLFWISNVNLCLKSRPGLWLVVSLKLVTQVCNWASFNTLRPNWVPSPRVLCHWVGPDNCVQILHEVTCYYIPLRATCSICLSTMVLLWYNTNYNNITEILIVNKHRIEQQELYCPPLWKTSL